MSIIYKTIPLSLDWECLTPAKARVYYAEAANTKEYKHLKDIVEVRKANRMLGDYFGHYVLSPDEYVIIESLLKNSFSAYEMQGFIRGFEHALVLINECETRGAL